MNDKSQNNLSDTTKVVPNVLAGLDDTAVMPRVDNSNSTLPNTPLSPRSKEYKTTMSQIEANMAEINVADSYGHHVEGRGEKRDKAARQRVHVLGQTPLGLYMAYSLAGVLEPPPITYLLHQPRRFQKWYDEGKAIECMRDGQSTYRTGIDVEFSYMQYETETDRQHYTSFDRHFGYLRERSNWIIEKLIVATGQSATIDALLPIRSRIGPRSTICLLNHGPGMVEQINRLVFPNFSSRPRYIVGTSTHGLHSTPRRFGVTLTTAGQMSLSTIPVQQIEPVPDPNGLISRDLSGHTYNESSTDFLRLLSRCGPLGVRTVPYSEMLVHLWERHLVDSVIHPLSAIFDCNFKELGDTPSIRRLIYNLLVESISIIWRIPEVRQAMDSTSSRSMEKFFSIKRFEATVYNRLRILGDNVSLMSRNVKAGTKTEIDTLNGYIVRKGQEVGIPAPVNMTVMEMIRAKQKMCQKSVEAQIPFS